MAWFQENWIIAVVGLVVAVVLLWWLFGRSKPQEIAPPTAEPAKPAKPLAPVKPEIIAAEPARFKPIEPKPQPVAPAPPPAVKPIAKAPPPPEPVPDSIVAPAPASPAPIAKAPKSAAQPKPVAKPAAKKAVANETVAKPAAMKTAAKPAPVEVAAAIPAEPTVPPPPATKPARAAAGTADNLQLLKGVGPKLAVLLNGLGVTHFRQIADWTDADIARIDQQLGAFQGRLARDNIVDQAGHLARGDKAGFEAKYGALGSEL